MATTRGVCVREKLLSLTIVLFVFAVSVPLVLGQSGSTAALTGRVTDPTGAVVPGVSVTATATGTNQTRTVVTAEDGVYRIPLLEPGTYRVRFNIAGFKTAEVMSVTL